MKVVLTRLSDDGKQTLGELNIYQGIEKLYSCKTLELSDKDNQRNISCIPRGTYEVDKYWSNRFGTAYMLKHVPNRSGIAIHTGNYFTQIQGCILVGEDFKDINQDNHNDVTSSRNAMHQLRKFLPKNFYLQII